jgi:hypothetical protein
MKRLLTTGGIVIAACAAAPATAGAGECDYAPTSRPFAQFGDTAD